MASRSAGEIKEILTLLQTALELSQEQRADWLATLDTSKSHLKPTVAKFLQQQAHQDTDDFVAAIAHSTNPAEADIALAPAPFVGALVGPYRLLSPLGEGGMSSVWLAERDDGVLKRKVALKLPHWWALSNLTERAVQERDILASLEHPNIARLYDAGITSDGRPYLALEHIEGKPIDVYCNEHAASLPVKVRLIAQIARAVAYAHSRLIVHRDLKPSNILIDADGQVHLLDFGIAKLIEDSGAANQAMTQVGTRLLTPEYASPEQILGEPVTTASDVYSLGVVAYELLACRPPYASRSGAGAESEIVTGQIRAPSSVVADRFNARALRGDLDTILLKALKKEPSERYTTAAAFADDLERYLRGDPVLARPDSAGYRLRKFAARNRFAVAASIAVVAALAIGLAVASWQLQVARAEKRHAEEVKEFVASIFRSADPFFTGNRQMTATQLLTLAKDRIDREMASQPENAAELLLIVGEAQSNLEQNDDAHATLTAALARAQGVLPDDSLHLARGRSQLALVEFQRGTNYDDVDRQLERAMTVLRAHIHEREAARELVSALITRGFMAGERGDKERALSSMREAVVIATASLGDDDSETILATRQLAQEYLMFGEVASGLQSARLAYERAHANFGSGGRDNLLVETEDVYGRALADAGELEKGILHLKNAVNGAERIFGPQAISVASKLSWLARAQLKLGDLSGAIASLERSMSAATDDLTRARVSMSLGLALSTARQMDRALEIIERSHADLQRLDETGGPWIVNAASTYGNALALARRSSAAEKILKRNLDASVQGQTLADTHNGLGIVALNRGDLAAARMHFEQSLQILSTLPASRVHVTASWGLGLAQLEGDTIDRAAATLEQAEQMIDGIIERPTPMLMDIVVARGRAALARGDSTSALNFFTRADGYWREYLPNSRWAQEAREWRRKAENQGKTPI